MELGKQIKKYRSILSLSQEQLAERVYVSRQTVSNWENEKNYPDINSVVLLSQSFRVKLNFLYKIQGLKALFIMTVNSHFFLELLAHCIYNQKLLIIRTKVKSMTRNYLKKFIRYSKKVYHIEELLKQLEDTRKNPQYTTAEAVLPVLLGFLMRIQSFNNIRQGSGTFVEAQQPLIQSYMKHCHTI